MFKWPFCLLGNCQKELEQFVCMYMSWIVDALLHFRQILHEFVPSLLVRRSTDDQPPTSCIERVLMSIQHIMNISNIRDVISVGIVNLTGFTLEEMFKREAHKPAEPVAKFSVKE